MRVGSGAWGAVSYARAGCGAADALRGAKGRRRTLWLDFAGWRVVRLVAGEETRSREAGQRAPILARHNVCGEAARRSCNYSVSAGHDCIERFHGETLPVALSIAHRVQGWLAELLMDLAGVPGPRTAYRRTLPGTRAPGMPASNWRLKLSMRVRRSRCWVVKSKQRTCWVVGSM
jgi:hypothetical protein